jgi:pimeloyl-[acyl-carrier protein] methyl ester esterase
LEIHFIRQGKGYPLIFFHGWGFDSHVWRSLLPELSLSYELWFIDLPGFGHTPYMPWEIFKQSLLKQLPKRFALAGWSMGGLFATRLVIEVPDRVTHLINIASSPYFMKDASWPGIETHVFNTFYENLTADPKKVLKAFVQLQLQGQHEPSMIDQIPSAKGLKQGLDVLLNWDLRPALQALKIPALYMFGRLDAIISRRLMVVMQERYPQFTYFMFTKAAHVPFLSHPKEFRETLEGFLL